MVIVMYLAAIVAANLLIARFGPSAAIVVAFLFIGLDITARDTLHERWAGRQLRRNMILLIGSGSMLSAVLNAGATNIAIASFAAFLVAGIADTLVFAALGDRARWLRVNGSNVVSAWIDSMIFPMIAFGFPVMWGVVFGQWVAKVVGGAVWYAVLRGMVPTNWMTR